MKRRNGSIFLGMHCAWLYDYLKRRVLVLILRILSFAIENMVHMWYRYSSIWKPIVEMKWLSSRLTHTDKLPYLKDRHLLSNRATCFPELFPRANAYDHFCEARRASHCHSPQTTYSSKSTCCAISAQNSAMHVVVYAGRLTSQRSIVEIINW